MQFKRHHLARVVRQCLVALAITQVAAAMAVPSPQAIAPKTNWQGAGSQTFSFAWDPTVGLTRGQGIAYDAQSQSVIFSGNYSMERTDIHFNRMQVFGSIPSSLNQQYRVDHIGCIDAWHGEIFAPLEDGRNGYQFPIIAKFRVHDLAFTGQYAVLPRDADQDDGVPWVAVDGAKGTLYTMKYDGAVRLNKFALDTIWTAPVRQQLALSEPLSRVQCAKVYGDELYALLDDATKSVKAVDLTTGVVRHVFNLANSFTFLPSLQQQYPWLGAVREEWEAEGLAIFPQPDGASLHVSAVTRMQLTTGPEQLRRKIPVGLTVFHFK